MIFIICLLIITCVYAWMLFAYLHYRQGRQEEFVQLLTTVAEAGAPLAPALRAYVHDRPRGTAREFWVAALLFFVLPGYYWLWHRRHSYDRKVERVAGLLDQGAGLHEALQAVPGIAPKETLLAVAIGESTGQLGYCLRHLPLHRMGAVWVEIVPRLFYPLAVLVIVSFFTSFWMLFIFPKFEKIYHDFKEPLPKITKHVAGMGNFVGDLISGLLCLAFVILPGAFLCMLYSSTLRWYLPGIGRLYRMGIQSLVLRMLGALLKAGKPAPEALTLLAASGAFPPIAKQRLSVVRQQVERGEPLAESLERGGLLRPALVPLLHAAERVHNLPWILNELSESLLNRLVRLVRRISMVMLPMSVLAIGVLVGFIVVGMFMPLVQLLTRLSE